MNLNRYRIYRTDPKNIGIQRRKGKRWVTISYHGNSLNSLILALFELIMKEYTPEQGKLSEQLAELKLELISGIEEVKEMIKDLITLDGQFLSWHTPLPVPGRGLFGRAHRGRCQVKTFARSAIRLEDDGK
jgi:hypothetical protein